MIVLNDLQKEAVNHKDGPCLVTSCPGSGKTRVLVERVISLIESGVNPKNILCLTFTNKAGNEMKQRIKDRLQVEKINFFIGTFHSLCAKILRKFGDYIGYSKNFTILDANEQLEFILKIARQKEVKIEREKAKLIAYAVNTYRDQMWSFEWVEDFLRQDIHIDIAEEYLNKCKEYDLIDFSSLISENIRLLENNNDILNKLQDLFKYIMVDETQDTNQSQFYLINLFAAKYKNVMLIGDLNQSIYRFRGARYQNINDFVNIYDNCKVVSLSKNYRSTPQIIEVAEKLIRNNDSCFDTKFETDNKDGESVCCLAMPHQFKEAEWIARHVGRLIDEGGWEAKDVAVLYRANRMSEPIERALISQGIPYEVIGAWNFYNRKEVKDSIAMLKFLLNPKDSISFHRICRIIKGIGEVTIGKIENFAEENNLNLIDACKYNADKSKSVSLKKACKKIYNVFTQDFDKNKPALCLNKLVNKIGLESHLFKKYDNNEAEERMDNIKQMIESASAYENIENGCEKYLQQVALTTSNDKEVKDNKVSLMTLHASKGLEFPIVFMIGVENNLLPHRQSLNEENRTEALEEERRLCYVGVTRAKDLLYLTWCKKRRKFGSFGNVVFVKTNPSLFLREMELFNY